MLKLKVSPDSPEERLDQVLENEILEVGRKPSASGSRRIIFPSPEVSSRHAEIRGHDGQYWTIRDLGSTNGTFLNGCRLSSGTSYRLEQHDSISICEHVIFIESCPAQTTIENGQKWGDCRVIPAFVVERLRQGPLDESDATTLSARAELSQRSTSFNLALRVVSRKK